VYATDVLSKILFPCESGARATFAVGEGTEEGFLGATMHLVDFALVAKESATVSEALRFLAALDVTLVRTIMLVHVFTMKIVSMANCKVG
jgi:hypothetical protein